MENISPKEILISIIVVILSIAVAILINPLIKDSMIDDVRQYQNALQVDGDSNIFQYAKQTQVGDVFAYGKMTAIHPRTIPELTSSYGLIEKVTERYTRHTRTVCDHRDDDGDCTSSHEEVYYTWDTYGRDTYVSDYFDFLSVSFSYGSTNLESKVDVPLSQATVTSSFVNNIRGNFIYDDTGWTNEGDLRHYYIVLPVQFNASMMTRFDANPENKSYVYYEMTRDAVLEDKEHKIRTFDFIYYLVWIIAIGCAYYYWAYNVVEIE